MNISRVISMVAIAALSLSVKSGNAECGPATSMGIITADQPGHEAFFGSSMAVSDGSVVIGAYGTYELTGAAHVLERTGFSSTPQHVLTAFDPEMGSCYGMAVDVYENVLVIGALEDSDLGKYSGSAYVYRLLGGQWVFEQKLLDENGAEYDLYGHSVSVDGDRIAVGAPGVDGDVSGAVFVYQWNGAAWTLTQKVVTAEDHDNNSFGGSVDLSGSHLLVGASFEDYGGVSRGAVYAFALQAGTWVEIQRIEPIPHSDAMTFGSDLDIDDDTAIIGAIHGDQFNGAYIYRFDGAAWNFVQQLIPSEWETSDNYGNAVALDGLLAVVGAEYRDVNGIEKAGAVHVFRNDGRSWVEKQVLYASEPMEHDHFGDAVALWGDWLWVGSPFSDDPVELSGSVEVFRLNCLECAGDVDGSGVIDPLDSGYVLARFGCPVGTGDADCDTADVNADGVVDPLDSGYVLSRFGECQ